MDEFPIEVGRRLDDDEVAARLADRLDAALAARVRLTLPSDPPVTVFLPLRPPFFVPDLFEIRDVLDDLIPGVTVEIV